MTMTRALVLDRCGGPGPLEFSAQLAELFPMAQGAQIRCTHLDIVADFVNLFNCTLALRFADAQRWNFYPVPDQKCASETELLSALRRVESKFRLARDEAGRAHVWLESYASKRAEVEFMCNRELALVLGLEPGRPYSGRVSSQPDVFALVRLVNVSSPLVEPSLTVNTSQLASLGTFQLQFDGHGLSTGCRKLIAGPAATCLPFLSAHWPFSLTSLLCPGSVIRAESFRLLACFVVDNK